MSPQPTNSSGWLGWVYFGGILLLVKAIFQAFLGIVALTKDDFYVVTNNGLAVFNYTAWGWIHLILAVVLLTAAFSLFSGGMWGRVVASLALAVSIAANLIFLPAYPVWGIVALGIDLLILYAVLIHGNEARK